MKRTIVVMSLAPFLSGACAGEPPLQLAEDLGALQMRRHGRPRNGLIFAQICCTASRRAS